MENQKNLYVFALVFCLIIGIYLIYQKAQPAFESYKSVQSKTVQLEDLKKQISDLKAKQDAYEKSEKIKTKPVYKNDLDSVDQMSSFGVMFEDVIQAAKYNGLKLRSISYNTNPAGDMVAKNLGSDYNVCAIEMQLLGSYAQFKSYFQDIFNYPYLINLDKISVTPYASNKKILIADVIVIIYSEKNAAQKAAFKAAADLQGNQEEGNK